MSSDDELEDYAQAGPMTALTPPSVDPDLLADLPTAAEDLCGVSKGLIVHEFLAGEYGVEGVEARQEELENRSAADLVALIDRLDPQHRPLALPRPAEQRAIGNCRQFSVLTCALFRHAGLPARARAGFANYFDDGWIDHWLVERWDEHRDAWQRTDPQLDEVQRRVLGFDFDPLRVPDGRFLTGSEAWRRCRSGQDDPERFGIQDMHGLWFVAGSVVRDLAAVQKMELLPWDTWGVMSTMFGELDDATIALVDELATAVIDGTPAEQREQYDRKGIRVPAVVRSQRFQRDVSLPLVSAA